MTGKTATRLILALGLAFATVSARADCRDDLAILNARLASANQKAPNVGAAKKELLKAEEEQKDELACSNGVARAWRAFRKPPPVPVNDQQ
jgi:hypothetical protein